MHLFLTLLPSLLPVLTSAAPLAEGSKIDGESILLLTCRGQDLSLPGNPWPNPGCFMVYMGVCIGPNGEILGPWTGVKRTLGSRDESSLDNDSSDTSNPLDHPDTASCSAIMGVCVDTGMPARVLRRLGARFEGWKSTSSKRNANVKTNSMAGYFPDGVSLSADGDRGHDTHPKALATVADPSIPWTNEAKTQELAGGMFTYKIKDGAANGDVAGSATLDNAKFSCVKDGVWQWNAWNLRYTMYEFGCTVDYACIRV